MMSDRACRNFQPNIFNKNKCQNCYKLKEAHRTSQTITDQKSLAGLTSTSSTATAPTPTSSFKASKAKNIVKSGVLSIFILESSTDKTKTHQNKWNRRWIVLNSSGIVDYYVCDELNNCFTDIHVGKLILDDCTNLFVGEVDTGDPFSIGLNTPDSTHYFKADSQIEIDSWTRVFRPFVQAAESYSRKRGSRNSIGSIEALSDNTTQVPSFNFTRGSSFGKASLTRPTTPTRTSSTLPKTRFTAPDLDLHPTDESLKPELEKLRKENKELKEKSTKTTRQRESLHILEQELKLKTNKVKELEKELSKCKDYQKAVIFQEQELQDLRFTIKDLRQQLEESEKMSKQLKVKLSIHGKELAEAKADLDEANSIISIHKANIEALKSEVSSAKQVSGDRKGRVILTDEEPESDRIFSFGANGEEGQKQDLESKLAFLVQKLKQNERELMIKTKELEKANESRSKVAKYTRSLLQELETKLSNNERKLAETEHQLKNSNIELDYEQEQKAKLEKEKERLNADLVRLIDLNKKVHLPKDAIALMKAAKTEKHEDRSKAELVEAEEKLGKVEKQFASREKELLDKIQSLENELTSLERLESDREKKFKENEKMLKAAYDELEKARQNLSHPRDNSVKQDKESVSELKEIISLKDNELNSASEALSDLEKDLAVLNRKNVELEKKLDSMDEKLCKSLEKQFSLSEENEKYSKEKRELESKIIFLEEKVSDSNEEISTLKMALSESICENDSNVEVEQEKLRELEKTLNEKNKELEKIKSSLEEKEKEFGALKMERELSALTAADDDESSLKLKKLEDEIGNMNRNTEELIREKDNELSVLQKENRRLQEKQDLHKDHRKEEGERVAELEEKILQYETYLTAAKERILEYESKINELTSQDRGDELVKKNQELENKVEGLEKQLGEYREKLTVTEEKLHANEVEEKLLAAELQKCKKDELFTQETAISVSSVEELQNQPKDQQDEKDIDYKTLLDERTSQLVKSEKRVVELAEELEKRMQLEQEISEWMEGVEANLGKTETGLSSTRNALIAKSQELDLEKTNVLDLVELSRNYIKQLESSLAEEKSRVEELKKKFENGAVVDVTDGVGEGTVETSKEHTFDSFGGIRERSKSFRDIAEKLASSEKERETHKARVSELTQELEETKQLLNERLESAERAHQKDMKKINEDTFRVSGAAKTEGDELRLRLTSRVITLQSDISELKAAHQAQIEKLKVRHKKELEKARREAILEYSMKQPIMESSEEMNASVIEMEAEMKDMVSRYENQMELLKQSHQGEMERIKRSSGHGEGLQTEVTRLQNEMEQMGQKYMKEIESLKVKHAEELDQLKTDMTLVIQASVGGSYSPTKDATEENTQQLKLRVKELEEEIEELNHKNNEELRIERESQQKELDQIRDDMMTVIQAVKSQQYDLDPNTEQLQRTVREQEEEIKRLKERIESGGEVLSDENVSKVEELEKANQLLTIEKDEIEKSLKRQEAATMFGLRRTEEMSNKIYQMQKEMEDIDRKYMKEINVYKEAYEREKEIKTKGGEGRDGDLEALIHENEELTLELEELKLKMEEDETLHENELKLYKEKLAQEKLLDVNDLRLQIKALEDSIEEIKLEHKREIEELQESHEKNVKSLNTEHDKEVQNLKKESLSSTTTAKNSKLPACEEHKNQIRTLDFKIEELESLLEVKKRRHKEEVRSLKERLDEEIKRRVEDERNYETKLKEYDGTRRASFSSMAPGPGASEYFRKQLTELRAENRSLKEENEALQARKTSSGDKPAKDTKRQASEPDFQPLALRKDSKEGKLPLRKASSDSRVMETESSKRGYRSQGFTKSEPVEKPLAKPFTRQSSKNEVKSVAARVAMFQTASKTDDKSTRTK